MTEQENKESGFPRLNSIRMYSAISPDGVMVFSAIPDSFPESYRKDCKCLFRDVVDIKEIRVRERDIALKIGVIAGCIERSKPPFTRGEREVRVYDLRQVEKELLSVAGEIKPKSEGGICSE